LASIRSFIEDGSLYSILDTIGDIHFKSAKLALKNIRAARDPQREVWLAIGHLQAAHVAFESICSKTFPIQRIVQQGAWYNACYRDGIACALMAVCYTYLGEKALVKKALEWMKKINQRASSLYLAEEIPGMFASLLNPSQWKYLVWNEVRMNDYQMEQLESRVLAS
jgi:hypothetical protein